MVLQIASWAAVAAISANNGPASIAAVQGREIAAQRCAVCHAVGLVGASPNSGAPPFRRLNLRYNPLALEQVLKRIALKGHYEMRPQNMSESEAEAVAAYIQTLEAPER